MRSSDILCFFIPVILFLVPGIPASAQPDVQVRFDAPAVHFTQSLPLGNGRLGAMVFGGTTRERIVLNEISMWSGGVEDPNRHDAHQYLKPIQDLLKQENNKEAQELLQKHFTSAGKGSGHGRGSRARFGCYQVLGDLFINWQDTNSPVSGYNRVLQVDKALATTSWVRNGVHFREEVIVSAPQQVIVIRLTTDKPGALSFDVFLHREEKATIRSSGNTISMTGQLFDGESDNGVRFGSSLRALVKNGKVKASGNGLNITGASECILVVGAATDLNWPHVEKRGPAPLPEAQKAVNAAAGLTWSRLQNNHEKDFRSLFDRCRLQFLSPLKDDISSLSTPQRLFRYASGETDVSLPALYFNFGRYLLISSSRPGSLPANLQGLWAEEYQTPWNGDYHLNINVQMNYWPAEKTNLAQCHEPLIQFTEQLVKPGSVTAKAYYHTEGWTAHMMSNPWKFTAPGESATWGSSLTGGAWLCEHLWEHYLYNPDKKYLQRIYPVLKGAARFYTGILITDPKTGWLVTAPSNSPENTYITADGFAGQTTMGPTMDMQIGRELLSNTIEAAKILGVDAAWSDSMQKIKDRLAPNQVSPSTGGIQEWIRDYKEAEPRHRHVSHLYGLHPYDEINKIETPGLMDAATKTLLFRGDEGTGWSRAWKINFWARLGDGDHALVVLKGLLQPAFTEGDIYQMKGAGTYPNLFCSHPPFQIDGNFGGTAAIAEMLMQSTGRHHAIQFLPALPSAKEWSNGKITGLCAPGAFVVDIHWRNGQLEKARILSLLGKDCYVRLPQGMQVYDDRGIRIKYRELSNGIVVFPTKKQAAYMIQPSSLN